MTRTYADVFSNILGKAVSFPFSFSDFTGDVEVVDETRVVSLINQMTYLVLSTRKGWLFGNPEFGSDLPTLLFEPLDSITAKLIRREVFDAITIWVPVIRLNSVTVVRADDQPHTAAIYGSYVLLKTPISGSFAFPFRIGSGEL